MRAPRFLSRAVDGAFVTVGVAVAERRLILLWALAFGAPMALAAVAAGALPIAWPMAIHVEEWWSLDDFTLVHDVAHSPWLPWGIPAIVLALADPWAHASLYRSLEARARHRDPGTARVGPLMMIVVSLFAWLLMSQLVSPEMSGDLGPRRVKLYEIGSGFALLLGIWVLISGEDLFPPERHLAARPLAVAPASLVLLAASGLLFAATAPLRRMAAAEFFPIDGLCAVVALATWRAAMAVVAPRLLLDGASPGRAVSDLLSRLLRNPAAILLPALLLALWTTVMLNGLLAFDPFTDCPDCASWRAGNVVVARANATANSSVFLASSQGASSSFTTANRPLSCLRSWFVPLGFALALPWALVSVHGYLTHRRRIAAS
ncbi:MAG: hypothetical protein U0166_25970 [Acidobacteriota bacterium]